ncbi:MAG: AAA family ATPase [Alphaproteobacteria bacterium]|nr:AAA family ATPase [Alphaproteobacteria bacterium]MBU0799261.1 AAA family ATPase [Alphaproteobacteria bacterium]MBU0885550.1 AAA family ATPase [Alphaproteobacteria bacterium]MBU1812973.1 AAA family ATPase [Alphaproteobacteria bacterium]
MKAKLIRAEANPSQDLILEKVAELDPIEVFSDLLLTQSFVTEGEIHRAFLSKGVATPASLVEAIASHDDTLRLYDSVTQEEVGWTLCSIRAQEKAIVARADALESSRKHEIGIRFIRVVARNMTLDEEQTDAMRHVLDAGCLKILEGRAGTGKSHTLSAIRQVAEKDGYEVIGLAPTNAVAQDLRDSGFGRATTVHSLLWYRDHAPEHANAKVASKSLIVVDEAAMLDTQRLDALTQLAVDTGAKLVLVGDDRQLASIERGGIFSVVRERVGSAALTSVRRQHQEWARQASRGFSEGQFSEGLEAYDAHGLIHWRDDLEAARVALLERWEADTEAGRGTRFVFAYTNDEVRQLNDAMQAIEIARGRVRDCITLETERGTLSVGAGDRVAFRGTWKQKGIYAGSLATVEVIDGDRVTVRSDRGRMITFDTREFTNIDLGYAGTIYRGQGKTLDQTYLLHTHHWRDAASYVAMTRARGQTEVFVGRDQASGLPELADQMRRQSDRGATLQYATQDELVAHQRPQREHSLGRDGPER